MRGDLTLDRIRKRWTSPHGNDVEIDIVGVDRETLARRLFFLGSIKWLENSASSEKLGGGHDGRP